MDTLPKLRAARQLLGHDPEIVVLHRDADNAGREKRLEEMRSAIDEVGLRSLLLPVIPVRMTEAWLLLDIPAIRRAAGNPRGTCPLDLPKPAGAERQADPKTMLKQALLDASEATRRRRDALAARFNENRRQLLSSLDIEGPVSTLESWQALASEVDALAGRLRAAEDFS